MLILYKISMGQPAGSKKLNISNGITRLYLLVLVCTLASLLTYLPRTVHTGISLFTLYLLFAKEQRMGLRLQLLTPVQGQA